MRPVRALRTCAAMTSSARQPLQIWRVRSSWSRPGFQVDLVGLDAGGVLALEEPVEALAQRLDGLVGDEALLHDEEAVVVKALDLRLRKVLTGSNRHSTGK